MHFIHKTVLTMDNEIHEQKRTLLGIYCALLSLQSLMSAFQIASFSIILNTIICSLPVRKSIMSKLWLILVRKKWMKIEEKN